MRKPWTVYDKRRGTRTIVWYKGKNAAGKWKRDQCACGRDYKLYQEKLKEITQRVWSDETGLISGDQSSRLCAEAFLAERKLHKYKPKTLEGYRAAIFSFIVRPRMSRMKGITDIEIGKWKDELIARGNSANTIIRRLKDLQSWLAWAVTKKYLARTPFVGISFPPYVAKPKFYTDEELMRFEEVLTSSRQVVTERAQTSKRRENEFRCIMRMAYLAGMREGEIVRVSSMDIHRVGDQGIVTVTSIKGKKRVPITRGVPLCREIMEILPRRIGLLFPDWILPTGEPHVNRFRWWFGKLKRKAGIKNERTFYNLRHSFARIFLERRQDMKAAADIMGHKDYQMIMQIYGHLSKEYLLTSVQGLAVLATHRQHKNAQTPLKLEHIGPDRNSCTDLVQNQKTVQEVKESNDLRG